MGKFSCLLDRIFFGTFMLSNSVKILKERQNQIVNFQNISSPFIVSGNFCSASKQISLEIKLARQLKFAPIQNKSSCKKSCKFGASGKNWL